jgi:hypothetical protein
LPVRSDMPPATIGIPASIAGEGRILLDRHAS